MMRERVPSTNQGLNYSPKIEVLEVEKSKKIEVVAPDDNSSKNIETKLDPFAFLDRDLPDLNNFTTPVKASFAKKLKKYKPIINWMLKLYYFSFGLGLFFFISAVLYYSGSSFSHLNH